MEVSALNLFSRPDKLKAMIPKKKRKNASEDHTNTSTLRTHNLRGVSNASINSNQNRSNMNLNSYALGNNPYQQNSSSLTLNYLKDQQNTAIQMHKRKTLSDSLTRLNLAEGMTQQQSQALLDNISEEDIQALQLRFSNMSVGEAKEQVKNIQNAIKLRQDKSKATDFSLLLDQVNDRIHMYKSIFFEKKPRFVINYQEEIAKKRKLKNKNLSRDDKANDKINIDEKRYSQIQKKKRDAFYDSLSTPRSKQQYQLVKHKVNSQDTFGSSTGSIGNQVNKQKSLFKNSQQGSGRQLIHNDKPKISTKQFTLKIEDSTVSIDNAQTNYSNPDRRLSFINNISAATPFLSTLPKINILQDANQQLVVPFTVLEGKISLPFNNDENTPMYRIQEQKSQFEDGGFGDETFRAILKRSRQEPVPGTHSINQTLESKVQDTIIDKTSQQNKPIKVRKHDASNFSSLKRGINGTTSLPFLQKLKIDIDSHHMKEYFDRRIQETLEKSQLHDGNLSQIDEKKHQKKHLRLLRIAEKKFNKLNQKSSLNKSISVQELLKNPQTLNNAKQYQSTVLSLNNTLEQEQFQEAMNSQKSQGDDNLDSTKTQLPAINLGLKQENFNLIQTTSLSNFGLINERKIKGSSIVKEIKRKNKKSVRVSQIQDLLKNVNIHRDSSVIGIIDNKASTILRQYKPENKIQGKVYSQSLTFHYRYIDEDTKVQTNFLKY
eukprot:403345724